MQKMLKTMLPSPFAHVRGRCPLHIACCIVLIPFILARPASSDDAQEPFAIIGDRPGFTQSAATVPPLHAQGELGAAYSTIGDNKVLTIPKLLLRIGVVRHLEVRLGAPSYTAYFTEDGLDWNVGGAAIGIKAAFRVGKKGSLGMSSTAALPLYGSQWRTTGLTLGIRGLLSVDLSDFLSLGGNLGVVFKGVAPSEADFIPFYLASLRLGLSLFGWFGAFVETSGVMNNDADVIAVADGGFTFLVTHRAQLDVHSGVGLTPEARGFDVGIGAIFFL